MRIIIKLSEGREIRYSDKKEAMLHTQGLKLSKEESDFIGTACKEIRAAFPGK